jgi:hypothetical protein
MNKPNDCRQLDLIMRAANALEQNRVPPPLRTEVTLLLKLLIAEYLAVGAVQPVETAADE